MPCHRKFWIKKAIAALINDAEIACHNEAYPLHLAFQAILGSNVLCTPIFKYYHGITFPYLSA